MSLEAVGNDAGSQVVYDRLSELEVEGIPLVVASGNTSLNLDGPGGQCGQLPFQCPVNECNSTGCQAWPASFPHDIVLSVLATDQHAARYPNSNIGAISVDLGAPGSNIQVIVPRLSDNGSAIVSAESGLCGQGTSLAAPVVSGIMGLLFADRPELHWRAAKASVFYSGDAQEPLQGTTASGRRANAKSALRWIHRGDLDQDSRLDLKEWGTFANCISMAGDNCELEFDLDSNGLIDVDDFGLLFWLWIINW